MRAPPPAPLDYETPEPGARTSWRWPVLILFVLLILGVRFCVVPLLTLNDWFPVPSNPPFTQPVTGTGFGSPTTAETE